LPKERQALKIGIDLDNTIILYDQAFRTTAIERGLIEDNCVLEKKALRDEIRNGHKGEYNWQKLQGFVYGRGIQRAELFPGVYRFLWRCRENKIGVEVVSHKTEFGHFDTEKYPLRKAATNFLNKNGLLDKKCPLIQRITFTNTQREKIQYIKRSNFNWFIDDLEEILVSTELESQKGILFCNGKSANINSKKFVANSWSEISKFFFKGWSMEEITAMTVAINQGGQVRKIEKLKGRGNSIVIKTCLKGGHKSILKIYPQLDGNNRLLTEYRSTTILNNLALDCVQRPISINKDLGIATYEWIEGGQVNKYGRREVEQLLAFLSQLHDMRDAEPFRSLSMAADSCTSCLSVENQIKRRLSELNKARENFPELEEFLRDKFYPAFREIVLWSRAFWPNGNSYNRPIERSELTLSPSDFGFHNALILKSGKLVFHDFEYFGWDDPAKLISDFSHHAAMNLSKEIEEFWFQESAKIYGHELIDRLRAVWPLHGLNWCLIILNEFKEDVWERRCSADNEKKWHRKEILSVQLIKARKKLNNLIMQYKNKHYW